MLKILGILFVILLSSKAFSHEFEVVVSDKITGEMAVERCIDEAELNMITSYLVNLNDPSVNFSVKKINMPVSVMAKKLGGGEGGGD